MPQDDLISRAAAIEAITSIRISPDDESWGASVEALNALPAAMETAEPSNIDRVSRALSAKWGAAVEYWKVRTNTAESRITELEKQQKIDWDNINLKADAIDRWTNTSAGQHERIKELEAQLDHQQQENVTLGICNDKLAKDRDEALARLAGAYEAAAGATSHVGDHQRIRALTPADAVAAVERIVAKRVQAAEGAQEEPATWQWRSRFKGSAAWDEWENGRYNAPPPPFMEIEERQCPAPKAIEVSSSRSLDDIVDDAIAASLRQVSPEGVTEALHRIIADRVKDALKAGPKPQPGPYKAMVCPNMPTDCCNYGVISLATGMEICRVWKEEDVRLIADLLNGAFTTETSQEAPEVSEKQEPSKLEKLNHGLAAILAYEDIEEEPVAWVQRHRLGPISLCSPDNEATAEWSAAFPVYDRVDVDSILPPGTPLEWSRVTYAEHETYEAKPFLGFSILLTKQEEVDTWGVRYGDNPTVFLPIFGSLESAQEQVNRGWRKFVFTKKPKT